MRAATTQARMLKRLANNYAKAYEQLCSLRRPVDPAEYERVKEIYKTSAQELWAAIDNVCSIDSMSKAALEEL